MRNLTEGNISKNFLMFSIPAIVSGLLSQSYSIINSAVVGKALGDHGLAAIGATSSFITVISAIIWGLITGISVYFASLFGAGEYRKMANDIKANLWIISILSAVISVAAIVFYKPVFALLKIGSDIYADSFSYFAIYMAGFTAIVLTTCFMFIFNAMGNTLFPFIMSTISSAGNLIINIISIVIFKKGVAAAATASVVMATAVCICYIVKLHFDFKTLGVSGHRPRLDINRTVTAWKQGIPCMIQQVAMYISSFGVQPIINSLGSAAISAYTICLNVYNLNSTIFQNSSRCLANYCSQCIGGGNTGGIKRGVKLVLRQSILIALPVMALCMLLPRQIVSLFYNDPTGESANLVVRYILICVPFIIVQIVNNMFHNFYRGVMVPTVALITTIIYSAVRIVSTYVLVPHLAMDGVYFGFIIAWVIELIVASIIYFTNVWQTDKYKNL